MLTLNKTAILLPNRQNEELIKNKSISIICTLVCYGVPQNIGTFSIKKYTFLRKSSQYLCDA